jgi:hypothetical protein
MGGWGVCGYYAPLVQATVDGNAITIAKFPPANAPTVVSLPPDTPLDLMAITIGSDGRTSAPCGPT